ncbi:MAG: Hsp70 family protein [Syntrophobacterales bacterium]|nr:Hsp70 family protein [Syntrophobacterales bacterium]
MKEAKYIIGIDLGTTHCVVGYAPIGKDLRPDIRIFNIPQVIAPYEIKPLPLLPSFLLMPTSHDVPPDSVRMPWETTIGDEGYVVGEFARKRGAEIPHRLISSAKSWLCHSGVDRTKAILPWGSSRDVKKLSPVEAFSLLLHHIKGAWNAEMAKDDPSLLLEHQDILITVPASFDVVARELTVKAVQMAGIEQFTLLEEPQAAFYGWIYDNEERWRELVKVGELILVCDVGGGTTDFSLIEVSEEDGSLALRRIAVGEHILLGGDNMDLALAYLLRQRLSSRLDDWQFRMLWYQCRIAKEKLLSHETLQSEPVVVLGRGTSLIGGTLRTELSRDDIKGVLLEGFFPYCSLDDSPQRKPKTGVREMGLPYEDDPAITRHMAYFLRRQMRSLEETFPVAVLFNGGVMKSYLFRRRVIDVIGSWGGGAEVRELASNDLDLAVAIGATYYGFVRRGRGVRIRAGASRTYYIGVESAMPSVPGVPAPVKALCVVPFGMEEGTSVDIKDQEFGLVVGDQAVFTLMASTTRKEDEVGAIVEDWEGDIQPIATMETLLTLDKAVEEDTTGTIVPVWLQSTMTEIGTLELHCVDATDPQRKWKLTFNLKERETD